MGTFILASAELVIASENNFARDYASPNSSCHYPCDTAVRMRRVGSMCFSAEFDVKCMIFSHNRTGNKLVITNVDLVED